MSRAHMRVLENRETAEGEIGNVGKDSTDVVDFESTNGKNCVNGYIVLNLPLGMNYKTFRLTKTLMRV